MRDELFAANRGIIISTLVFSFVLNILALTGSVFMLQVYDRVIPSGSIPTLLALGAIVAVLYVFYGVMDGLRARIFVRVGRKLEEALRARSFDVMAQAALKQPSGVGSLPVQDLAALRQYIGGQGPMAWFDMPYVPVYLAVCFLLHPILGYVATAAAVIIFALAILTERAQRQPQLAAQQAAVKAQLMTEESRRNVEAMQALGMRAALRERWARQQGEAVDWQTRANDAGAFYYGFSRVFRMIVQSGMLGVGAWLAVKHEISSGSIVASSIILGRALAPIEQAVGGWQQFLNARRSYERLSQFLGNMPPAPPKTSLPKPLGELVAEAVAIVLPGSEKPVLQGINFKLSPGKGLGIIGPTGAGKSTLARALVGLVPVQHGSIRLDGATADQRDGDELGRMIGYLPQDVQVFDGTVAENIGRFSSGEDSMKVVKAAKAARIHEFILRLPKGYDTPLGSAGARLSAGQRQRLALARALYGDPVLLVLDEPNSALDSEGEAALDAAIRETIARGASVIVVTHRPSALQAVEHVVVLAGGTVAMAGPRDEILAKVAVRAPPAAAPAGPAPRITSTSMTMSSKVTQPGSSTRN